MNAIELQLFGVFRSWEPTARLRLPLAAGARIGEVRAALAEYAAAHWPPLAHDVLAQSAFADASRVLRDDDAVPHDGALAVLPPVNGG
ncbi:thiamine biosynthesis protein ThiS [Lysobacter pythonis]|uniref:Thiamine biosynthesis protein ThiS n=1 Tax=Solilutibacter pythonis TaxID=2483112 RepID=A0A3M2I5Q3_9GAMM|nr:thiamine biosynthesis protein ThiS [Lysobacter pythonis]RMH93787.1 thiamine biosynthesis protein ThiS [Lysobacter pythonis]